MRALKRLIANRYNRRTGWRFVGATIQDVPLDAWPTDFWKHDWLPEHESVLLSEPLYTTYRSVPVYRVESAGSVWRFATREFSNGVWGFYLPVA